MISNAPVADVRARAQSALAESPIFALRDISVNQDGNSLLLSGRVDTFYHKQLAQEVVRAVAGKMPVVNSVDVEW